MAALDIARRNGSDPGCFAVAGQRAGIFEPLQFLSPQIPLVPRSRLFAFPFSGRQFFALGLGHFPEFLSAHRFIHASRCAAEG